MSDTTVEICGCCEEETDCISNRCSDCSQPNHKQVCSLVIPESNSITVAGAALGLGGIFLVLLIAMYIGQLAYTERALASCNAKIHANS